MSTANQIRRFYGPIVGREVVHDMPPAAPSHDLFVSEPVAANQLFDRLGIHWIEDGELNHDAAVTIEVRTSADGSTWNAWTAVRDDHYLHDHERNERYAPPLLAMAGARFAQYRVQNAGTAGVKQIALTFIDTSDLNAHPLARALRDLRGRLEFGPSVAEAAVGAPKILTRQDWAADETLMQWTPQYPKPQTKAVIHHTVTDDGGSNVAATIRGIYYYHAVTRRWGDIGYNYLVDKFGNIWVGRQGGDHVEAGHAYGWNRGSFGVASIGDYSNAPPTSALQGALANIVALKFAQYNIQPFGNDPFTHQEQQRDGTWIEVTSNPPNVQGHRDASYIVGQPGGQTACPGNGIYNMLDGLRRLMQNAMAQGYSNLVRFDPVMPRGTFPGSAVTASVTVTNRGATPVPAGTMVSYRLLKGGTVVTAQGAAAPLQQALAPGASGTVSMQIPGPANGEYVVRWDLQANGVWWNALYGSPYRDVWLKSTDWSADWQDDNIPNAFAAGEVKVIRVVVANDGGRVWNATGTNPVQFTYTWTNVTTGAKLPGVTKIPLPSDVVAGQTITVNLPIVAPTVPANYTLTLDLEKLNEFKFGDRGIPPDDTSIAVLLDYKATYRITPPASFNSGVTVAVPVVVTNTGRGILPTALPAPVRLGYHWYDATGKAVVYDSPRTILPADLVANASVSLVAQVAAPPSGGSYRLAFDLVHEGVTWFSAKGNATGDLAVNVIGPAVKSYGATYQPAVVSLATSKARVTVPLSIVNTSNFTWLAAGANPVTLSYHWVAANGTMAVWDGLRTKLVADVAANAAVTVQAAIEFPPTPGVYSLRWDLVEEGVSWFSGKGVPALAQQVTVGPEVVLSYGGSIDASKTPSSLPTRLVSLVPLRVQNLSSFDFDASINLSYHWVDGSGNAVIWDGQRTSLAGLKVGEVRALDATVSTPTNPGQYTLRWDFVREGVTWFSAQGMQMPSRAVTVVVPEYSALYAVPASASGVPGAAISVPVTITNVGTLRWQGGLFNLSYHLTTPNGTVVTWDGVRTALPAFVDQGQSYVANAIVRLPVTPGTYTLTFDIVQEGVTWFSDRGVPGGSLILTVA